MPGKLPLARATTTPAILSFWPLVSGVWLLGFIPPVNRRVIPPVNPPLKAARPLLEQQQAPIYTRMDAPNPSASPTFASRAPIHIGTVGLKVRHLDGMTTFYRELLGLTVLEKTASRARLGVGDVTIVDLEHDPAAIPDDEREAGLYHTAFLQPTRVDLARWLIRIARHRVVLTGASDHSVSEAIYLDDPEGNGIEVYRDRPREDWIWNDGELKMSTDPLDIDDLLRAGADAPDYETAPGGLRIGHMHLRVGNTDEAGKFYSGILGLDMMRRLRVGAIFMSSGGYHHHLGSNVWHSRGAGRRNDARAGLSYFSFEIADPGNLAAIRKRFADAGVGSQDKGGGFEIRDPWGTRVRFVQA